MHFRQDGPEAVDWGGNLVWIKMLQLRFFGMKRKGNDDD